MRDRRGFLEILFFTASTTFFTRTDFLLHGVSLVGIGTCRFEAFHYAYYGCSAVLLP